MLRDYLAVYFNQRGRTFLDRRADFRRAEQAFRRAAAAAPGWSVPWYNLGLIFKRQRFWRESLDCNQKALERNPSDEAAWWNLGISATALGNWSEARRAWTGCSRGSPGPSEHDDFVAPDSSGRPIRLMAAAPDEGRLRALLDAWTASDPGGSILRVAVSAL